MRRRSFLSHSTFVALGAALTQMSSLYPEQRALAADAEEMGLLDSIRSIQQFELADGHLKDTIVKGLDLAHLDLRFWERAEIRTTYFLGCTFGNKDIEDYLQRRNAFVVRRFDGLEYEPYRSTLYSPDELMTRTASSVPIDDVIYEKYIAKGKLSTNLIEALTRRIHDFSMDDCLMQLTDEIAPTGMVCITGGFFQDRTDPWFRKTAEMARLLSMDNKFVVTGGGPGIMEAANLGAYLSAHDDSALDVALSILAKAPKWTDENWRDRALEVKERFPEGRRSLGIPTWFYGFEPTNLFASDIAKYFDNSIREGLLMSIAKGGAVFAPGSAGARQEIFMAATQNHFGSIGYHYPMVLFGKEHYQVDTNVFQLLQQVSNENYRDLLYSTDDPAEVVGFIRDHPPTQSVNPSY